jgi:hypothetical protein
MAATGFGGGDAAQLPQPAEQKRVDDGAGQRAGPDEERVRPVHAPERRRRVAPERDAVLHALSRSTGCRVGGGERRTRYRCAHAPAVPIVSTSRTNTTSSFVRPERCAPRIECACTSSSVKSIMFSHEPMSCGLGEHQRRSRARESAYLPKVEGDGGRREGSHRERTKGLRHGSEL